LEKEKLRNTTKQPEKNFGKWQKFQKIKKQAVFIFQKDTK